ncbi:MAG TPA: hypothetical protein VIO11_03130 [Candidatus Methanoperedens sp.]
MKNYIFKIFLILFIVNILPSIASASEFRSGDTLVITKNEVVNDDIYFAGSSVTVDGTINGDLVVAGGEIKVNGKINGSVMAAGGTITINGIVTNDIRAAGGEVRIGGNVEENVLVFSGNLILDKNARIGRDLTLGAGTASIDGSVDGNIDGGVSNLEIGGATKGNVTVRIDNSIRISPGATIGGNLEYTAPSQGEISGVVSGKTTFKETPARKENLMSKTTGEIIGYFMLLLIGILSLILAPGLTQKISDNVAVKPLKNLFWGLVFLIIIPIVAILLFITIIGIPLSLMLLIIYIIILYISRIYVGLWIGQYVLEKLRKGTKSRILTMALGLLILVICVNLPVIGILINIIIFILGFGTIILTGYEAYLISKEQKVI